MQCTQTTEFEINSKILLYRDDPKARPFSKKLICATFTRNRRVYSVYNGADTNADLSRCQRGPCTQTQLVTSLTRILSNEEPAKVGALKSRRKNTIKLKNV